MNGQFPYMPTRLTASTAGPYMGPGPSFTELAAFVPLQQQVRSFQLASQRCHSVQACSSLGPDREVHQLRE
jgi:hypothetical protein